MQNPLILYSKGITSKHGMINVWLLCQDLESESEEDSEVEGSEESEEEEEEDE